MTLESGRGNLTAPQNPGRDPVTAPLIAQVTHANDTWSATLALDLDDPYFFDHPLDHVPGMALVAGLLDLIRFGHAGHLERADQQLTLSLEMSSFCGLESPVDLEVTQLSGGDTPALPGDAKGTVRALQNGRVACRGDITFSAMAPASPPPTSDCPTFPPADPAIVHRQRPENVLVSGMLARGHTRIVALQRPDEGHRLAVAPGRPLRTEALIDAARQFCTMVCHLELGSSADTQFILLSIQAELPCVPEVDLFLSYTCTPQSRGRASMIFDVVGGSPDSDPCGRVTIDYYAVSPAVYRHLRRSGVSAR